VHFASLLRSAAPVQPEFRGGNIRRAWLKHYLVRAVPRTLTEPGQPGPDCLEVTGLSAAA
jgi:hypothetical protein